MPAFGGATYFHILGDAFQRAFIDRNERLGDPAFVSVPVARLTDKAYARQLRATIAANRATPTSHLGADPDRRSADDPLLSGRRGR